MKNTGWHKWVSKIFQALLLAALSAGLVGWNSSVSAQSTPPVDPTPTVVSDASQRLVVRVGGSATNPPYEYIENAQPVGFSIDVIKAVAREMGFDVEFNLTTTEQARQDLLDGKLDMLTGVAYSTNRDSTIDFSVPITYTSFDLYVRNDSLARSLEDVRGKEIVVISGSVVQDFLESERFTSRMVQVSDATEAIRLLSQNDYAGTILSRIQAEYLIRSMNVTNLHRVGADIMTRKFAFGVAEGDRELLAKLNEGLYILSTSGALQDLQEHWFGVYEVQDAWVQLRPYIIGLGAALLFLFATLLWIWSLRRQVNVRTRELRRSQNQYRLLVDNATEGVIVSCGDQFVFANTRAAEIFGYPVDELIGQDVRATLYPEDNAMVMDRYQRRLNGEDVLANYPFRIITRSNEVRWVNVHSVLIEWEGKPATLDMFMDTTEGRRAEDQIQQQLKHMAALRAVDMAITASMDLPLTLRVLLEQVTAQLSVDAASVLLLEENTEQLAYAAGQGFITNAIRDVHLQVGRGFSGTVALQRRLLRVDNLNENSEAIFPPRWVKAERFVAYIGVPLISKGEVQGVLEIFQRSPLGSDPAWMNFLESIANQAAIAIDNARLLKDLQTANLELTMAYDATIEGWARALELRDGETEGHSHRVAAMTVALANEMGLHGEDLLHIRRGALLHDIGKMAIPDSILKKQDNLTDVEWEIMRKHPIFSVEMLSQIDFLRPALSIPQSHHEWWDGTGYPRKLKGEEIPLAARIFSVVDVWDALIYNRRYRKGWAKEKVMHHLQSLSGKQFDPRVVTEFLEFIASNGAAMAEGEPENQTTPAASIPPQPPDSGQLN